jgi:mannitol/fructose-specific phosphotransferase system IIA component (Ntr-type)
VFFKKINKKQSIILSQIKNKLIHEDFSDVLANESNEKFIAWVFAL